jgi:hypothetical protein
VQQALDPRLLALAAVLDAQTGRYEEMRHVSTFGSYLEAPAGRADEETLTEPILAQILERVLGFPGDEYVPQLSRSGLKPDFTPRDLIAHSFVLDAKSSDQSLPPHIPQIRAYVQERSLNFGILFNLRELRVYRRGSTGFDDELSFKVLPLWQLARGEAIAGPEYATFLRFCDRFAFQPMNLAAKIEYVRRQDPWSARLAAEPQLRVDVEFLVEQLRKISRQLADDADGSFDQLRVALQLGSTSVEQLQDELRLLALEIAPGTDLATLPADPLAWRAADGLALRVWRQYLLRVAYLALTRILLYRSWEDVDFVESYLYDGGFDTAYERLESNVLEVLARAFAQGAQRYRWLFAGDNNYDWYRPGEAALVDVLYLLAPVPLGKLDADVLGGLYVSYVDEIDRDRLGQFFTPRPVVRFMLDRAGFHGADVFRLEGDERKPRRLLDFATGSGGFLVEAARRVIDDGGVEDREPKELLEALGSIVRGFTGAEISPFPYYLTEVNLLLQVSRLLGKLKLAQQPSPPPFVLGVVHVDMLAAKSAPAVSLEKLEAGLRGDRAELTTSGFGLAPLEGEKRMAFGRLREDAGFDVVVGNPPYVAEANNKPLFDRLRAIDAWKGVYRGKTDYLYYFLWVAAEKLAPGGRLCVITPAGWMNAGAADFLREKLAAELRLDELFLFGSYRLFAADQGPAPTPTVESAILVATKAPAPEGHAVRVVALEDESEWEDRDRLLAELAKRAGGKAGRAKGIHVHDVPQVALRPEHPWPVKFAAEDLATRVVAHLQAQLDDSSAPAEPLAVAWKVFLGIQTGADAYSRKIETRLPPEVKEQIARAGGVRGDPIYALPPGVEDGEPWLSASECLVRSPEPEAVLYGAVDDRTYVNLVWLTRATPPSQAVLDAVGRWRPLLQNRAEFRRNTRRAWWETCWPRDPVDLASPKVIALHRTDRGRFSVDEEGRWAPSGRMSVVVARSGAGPVAYLCGLLNSELLDLWYSMRGRRPRDVWRDYEPKPMGEMPYRRPEGDPRADEVADLVRAVAANRRALLPHRAAVRNLGQTIKDPWRTGPVEVDDAGLVAELAAAETVSVRLDPALAVEGAPAGRTKRTGPGVLSFRRGQQESGRISGDPRRLDLLETLIGAGRAANVPAVVLPKDVVAHAARRDARYVQVRKLLEEGRELVERVERLVCGLYGLSDEMTDEVVAHALARAARSAPPATDG